MKAVTTLVLNSSFNIFSSTSMIRVVLSVHVLRRLWFERKAEGDRDQNCLRLKPKSVETVHFNGKPLEHPVSIRGCRGSANRGIFCRGERCTPPRQKADDKTYV